ncbi:MAG: transcription elongation factor GreA [Nitrospirota bacterium]
MKHPMTKEGYNQLRKELDRLKKEERPKVIIAIAEARAHGDLSENAEYSAAKERQSFIEGRITEIEAKLASAQVIDTAGLSTETVVFGVTVVIKDINAGAHKTYRLVGQDESDLQNGKISVQSPVGRALIGRRAGDVVEVQTPARQIVYEIIEIKFL